MELLSEVNQYVDQNLGKVKADYRQAYHMMAPIGWINDPNGFVQYKGVYHLFCQYHPYSAQWGPMHWGHWTSLDLVHWKWQGVALAPDTEADCCGCFSGTAIVHDGTLYLMYTGVSRDKTSELPHSAAIPWHIARMEWFFRSMNTILLLPPISFQPEPHALISEIQDLLLLMVDIVHSLLVQGRMRERFYYINQMI